MTNKDQLPVIQLNYGASGGRFSQIKYKLDNLRCAGKADLVVYPSEHDENIIDVIENVMRNNTNEVAKLKAQTENSVQQNANEIAGLTRRTDKSENDIEVRVSVVSPIFSRIFRLFVPQAGNPNWAPYRLYCIELASFFRLAFLLYIICRD